MPVPQHWGLGATWAETANPALPCSPLMLNDSGSAHSLPKYGRQYSLEPIHGSGPYSVSSRRCGPGWVRRVLPQHKPHVSPPLMAGSVPGLQWLWPLLLRCRFQLWTHHLGHH